MGTTLARRVATWSVKSSCALAAASPSTLISFTASRSIRVPCLSPTWCYGLAISSGNSGPAAPDAITEPVLDAYGTIRHQDAILDYDARAVQRDEAGEPMSRWDGLTKEVHPVTGKEVPDPNARTPLYVYENPRSGEWPEVEYIVGNPPFVGGKDMRPELGDGYSEACWKARPHVPGGADFVMHLLG